MTFGLANISGLVIWWSLLVRTGVLLLLCPLSLNLVGVQNVQGFQQKIKTQTIRTTTSWRFIVPNNNRDHCRRHRCPSVLWRGTGSIHNIENHHLLLLNSNNDNVSKALDLFQTSTKIIKEIEPYVEKEAQKEEIQNEEEHLKDNDDGSYNSEKATVVERQQHDDSESSENDNNNNNKKKPPVNIEAIDRAFQYHRTLFQQRAQRTRLFFLRTLATWAYDVCLTTNSHDGKRIDSSALYAGCLLVHLHLSKYVGVAACLPPTREQVDELFELADVDGSGDLDQEEFTDAIIVACTPIAVRVFIYWSLLAILPSVVTYIMTHVLHFSKSTFRRYWHHIFNLIVPLLPNILPHTSRIYSSLSVAGTTIIALMEWLVKHMLSILFFSVILPYLFSRVDSNYRKAARERYLEQEQSTLWYLPFVPGSSTSSGRSSDGSDQTRRTKQQIKRARGYLNRVGRAWYTLQDSMFGSTYNNKSRRSSSTTSKKSSSKEAT